jgi:hypothetical protein
MKPFNPEFSIITGMLKEVSTPLSDKTNHKKGIKNE